MRVLCIDYGIRNLGFATAETPLATPHSIARIESLSDAIRVTTKVVEEVLPGRIVVGIPEGEIAISVTNFVTALRPLVSVDVVTHEETLSSQEATIKLRAGGASRAKLKADHAYAACLILEDYLDANPELVKI